MRTSVERQINANRFSVEGKGMTKMSTTTGNIIHTGTPSRSALMVAKRRAVHKLLDDPLIFDDPFALPILGADIAAELTDDPFQLNDPMSRGLRAALIVRSKVA